MVGALKKLLIKELRVLADNIEADNTHLTEAEAIDLFSVVAHQALTKEEALLYTNCSRATFDNYIRAGIYPKGRKIKGRKELIWYKDEISNIDSR